MSKKSVHYNLNKYQEDGTCNTVRKIENIDSINDSLNHILIFYFGIFRLGIIHVSAILFLLLLSACSAPEITLAQRQTDPKFINTPVAASIKTSTQSTQAIASTEISTAIPTTQKKLHIYGSDYRAIQLAWFYKPPITGNLANVASNYSTFILTRNDEKERNQIQQAGIKTPVLQYILFNEIQNPGSCTKPPFHNQVADKPGDYCNLKQDHPDWFLQDTSGKFITNKSGYSLMDPGNNDWRLFWLKRVKDTQEQYGWNGVFLDNVEASLNKRIEKGAIPENYQDVNQYQKANEEFLKYIYNNFFEPNKVPLYANIIALNDSNTWFRYVRYLDGAMIENFATGWNNEYLTETEWESQLQIVSLTQDLGKTVILVSQGEEFDFDRFMFSLASYLLVNNGKAYFRYTSNDSYDQNWLYDQYNLDLGKPLGDLYHDVDSWKREFEHATIIVNTTTHKAEIKMK